MDRPELDEFLSALSGFLDQKTTLTEDPSYHRFLEIFCRSVGSAEGHLLRFVEGKGLQSMVSSGVPPTFDQEFNEAVLQPGRELAPLDSCYRDHQVVAVVEIKRGGGIADWFLELTNRYKLKSLIAVPLIGTKNVVGVLCAYYRDACLFDQGTLDRLMTIGRMVGTALEKSISSPGGASEVSTSSQKVLDDYLAILTQQSITRSHIFSELTKIVTKALMPSITVCGPVRVTANELVLTVAEGAGIPMTAQSQRLPFPAFLARQLLLGKGHSSGTTTEANDWGAFRSIIGGAPVVSVCEPILWQKQPQAAILVWRSVKKPFTSEEGQLLSRLAGITALAMRAV